MPYIKRLYIFLFLLGAFFIPFNSQPPEFLSFLGEYRSDSSPLFFLLGFIVLLFYDFLRGKFYFPVTRLPYALFLVFSFFLLITFFINYPNISEYYFKKTTGSVRFFKQIVSVAISSVIFYYLYISVVKEFGVKRSFLLIRKTFLISLYFVAIYGFIEFVIINLNLTFLKPFFSVFDYLPFVKPRLDFTLKRISSLTYEPPALGMYLITISGFMFSYILTGKTWKKYIPFFIIIVLALMSKSRTAFVVLFVQAFLGIYITYMNYTNFRKIFNRVFILVSITLVVLVAFNSNSIYNLVEKRIDSLNFIENRDNKKSDNAVSNKSRLGIQYANWQVFKQHPIAGVGWGQQAYEAKEHYPKWAMVSNYEFRYFYLNEDDPSFPPGYNLYLRVLTETGIIGLLLLLLFFFSIVYKNWNLIRTEHTQRYLAVSLMICFMGFLLNWFQIDSLRIYGFWICLAILMDLRKIKNI